MSMSEIYFNKILNGSDKLPPKMLKNVINDFIDDLTHRYIEETRSGNKEKAEVLSDALMMLNTIREICRKRNKF